MKTKTEEALCPSHNSGYAVPLRFTQIFAPLRSAKTSYSHETLRANHINDCASKPLKK